MKRVFLVVLDSFGIGEMPDANLYGDAGSDTLRACYQSKFLSVPNMRKLGLFNIDGLSYPDKCDSPIGNFARMTEKSKGKDTIIGHWEIAGIESLRPLPTYPNGFPQEIIEEFEKATGYKTLCNKPYSGTKVLMDYGKESIEDKKLIVYTSGDSVFQIAAHEDIVPVAKLYEICEIARKILTGKHAVGRVIARPFVGEYPNFTRTSNRHDFSLAPPKPTILDLLSDNNKEVIAVGKINDIFSGKGISESIKTSGNADGIEKMLKVMDKSFEGLCFVNLVDFDMLYGHRNDVDGYAKALSYFDLQLEKILNKLKTDDVLIITADHGCDPSTASTDHSREYTPMLMYGNSLKNGVDLGTRKFFGDIGATILEYFKIENTLEGESFLRKVKK